MRWTDSFRVAGLELAWLRHPAESAFRGVGTLLERCQPSFQPFEAIIIQVVGQSLRGPFLIDAQADAERHEGANGCEEGERKERTHEVSSE